MGERQEGARGWAAALAVGVYLAYFDRAVPGAVAPLVGRDFGLSDTALGFATATAAALAYAGVAIVLAIGDDGGRRRRDAALIGGMIAWTAGAVALAFAGSFAIYVAAEMLVGAGQAAFVPAAATAIVGAGGVSKLGRATARFTNASTLGRSSAMLVTGLLVAAIAAAGLALPRLPAAWRAVFLLTAVPNVIVIAVVFGLRGASASEGAAAADEARLEAAHPALIGGFLVAAAPVMLIQAVGAWYPVLLVRVAGLAPARAAVIAGAATLVAAPLGQWIGGLLLDRRPERRRRPGAAIVPALTIAGLALAVLGQVGGLTVAVTVLAGVDLALGMAAAAGLSGIQALAGPLSRRRTNSVFFAGVTLVGVGLGPLLAGRLSDLGGASGAALASALAALAVPAVAAALAGHLLMAPRLRYRGSRAP